MIDPIKIVEIIRPKIRVERPRLSGDLAIFFDDFEIVTIHYDYAYTSNSTQWALAKVICDALGIEYPGEATS
jgi:hypothetical protein